MKTTIDLTCSNSQFWMAFIAPHTSEFELKGSGHRVDYNVKVSLPIWTQEDSNFSAAIKAGKKVRVTFEILPD